MKFQTSRFVLLAALSLLLAGLTGCGTQPADYQSMVPITELATADESISLKNLPEKINLDVPFFSQAPTGDWGIPYQESCEEASLLLAYYYVTGQTFSFGGEPLSVDSFERDLLEMVDWEVSWFGQYEHTTVAQTAEMASAYLGHEAWMRVDDPSVEELKGYLAAGYPVVVPFAGRALGNPFFSGEGPVYHMLVIRGYDDSTGQFITNDVGTRHGENFVYSYDTVMNALHDWHDDALVDDAGIFNGEKEVLVLMPA